ncbi:MAG TPA: CARDB domain-containing protein [Nitrosopumilaceae archaeon]|nr:CARDB domain-containing protein [Nitrosopumilaceae archaeon]
MKYYLFFFVLFFFIPAYGMQNTISDSNVQVIVNYPDILTPQDDFVLSSVVKTSADQVSNITITISSPELNMTKNQFHIDSLPKDSTLGNNFNAQVKNGTPDGSFLANIEVQYFIKGFFDKIPVKNSFTRAIEFNTQSKPLLLLNAQTPDEAFAGEPFSITGQIKNQGSEAQNIQMSVDSSQVELSGKKIYSLTNLEAGKSSDFEFVVQTQKDLTIPTHASIHLNGTYSDKSGKTYSLEDSLNVFVRQRGMMEIGGAQGIWLGNFFIAPVVGVGTIVSTVIGFLIFLWHHFKHKKTQKRARK